MKLNVLAPCAFRVEFYSKGYVQDDDKVTVEFSLESVRDIQNAIIGYQIKDKYGNTIFGENTHSSGFGEFSIEKNAKMIGKIEFRWPQLQDNVYFLTLGVGEGTHEMQHIIQCWAHNIFELSSITNKPNHGLFNVKIDDFTIGE